MQALFTELSASFPLQSLAGCACLRSKAANDHCDQIIDIGINSGGGSNGGDVGNDGNGSSVRGGSSSSSSRSGHISSSGSAHITSLHLMFMSRALVTSITSPPISRTTCTSYTRVTTHVPCTSHESQISPHDALLRSSPRRKTHAYHSYSSSASNGKPHNSYLEPPPLRHFPHHHHLHGQPLQSEVETQSQRHSFLQTCV